MKNEIRIAGVTFANEDGQSRQEILGSLASNMAGSIITVDLLNTVYHNPDTNEDEFAIRCVEHNTRKCIGWIPRAELRNENLDEQMTGFIRVYKGNYYVSLDNIKRPSQKQYHYIKNLCTQMGIPVIAYDVRAYAYVFNLNREVETVEAGR